MPRDRRSGAFGSFQPFRPGSSRPIPTIQPESGARQVWEDRQRVLEEEKKAKEAKEAKEALDAEEQDRLAGEAEEPPAWEDYAPEVPEELAPELMAMPEPEPEPELPPRLDLPAGTTFQPSAVPAGASWSDVLSGRVAQPDPPEMTLPPPIPAAVPYEGREAPLQPIQPGQPASPVTAPPRGSPLRPGGRTPTQRATLKLFQNVKRFQSKIRNLFQRR